MNMLSADEKRRYNRHMLLPEIGPDGQLKLKHAKVLVIGAGGLGCPVLQYLGAAGIGTLGIVDFDVVDESNLQRQILYATSDVGKSKAQTAAVALKNLNPYIDVVVFAIRLDVNNALEIISAFDIIVDGSDNFTTRYLINDACVIAGKPLVSGAIFKFEGQLSVFNYKGSGSYRCLFPEEEQDDNALNCSEVGVLGVLPGIIGTMQASEVLKIILGIGETLHGKLLVLDALAMNIETYSYSKKPENFNLQALKSTYNKCVADGELLEVTAGELKLMMENQQNFQLIDVREIVEYHSSNLGGLNIPWKLIENRLNEIARDRPVVLHCQSGARSKATMLKLQALGFVNVKNLSGGLNAWLSLSV